MKTLALVLAILISAPAAQAILILPYGHWSLTGVSCSAGGTPKPGITRGSRSDLHILEEEQTFEAATLNRDGWSVLRGKILVDHQTASICLRAGERVNSGEGVAWLRGAERCGRYAKPADDVLELYFSNSWDSQSCPAGQRIKLTYKEL